MMKSLKFAAAAAAVLLAASGTAHAQQHAKAAPHRAAAARKAGQASIARLGGHPNLNGIWQVMSTANWNLEPHEAAQAPAAPEKLGATAAVPPGIGVVEGGQIPYLPAALEQRNKNRHDAPMADPEAACYLPGIPRATYLPYPWQIIQADDGDMQMIYEYDAANRLIYMKKAEQPPIDTWMGTSYGQWDGDTLVVTTLGQNGRTWLDRAGNYLTPTAKVVERFRLKDHDHMDYEATIEDPAVYSKPWKISMVLYRRVEPRAEILDFRCVPFADLLVYGDLLQKRNGQPDATH